MSDAPEQTNDAPEQAAPEAPAPEASPAAAAPAAAPDAAPDNSVFGEVSFEPSPAASSAHQLPVTAHAESNAIENQGLIKGQQVAKSKAVDLTSQLAELEQSRKINAQWNTVSGMQDFVAEQEKRNKAMLRDLQAQSLRYRAAVDHMRDFNPNPWADRGVGFTIGAALAAALGGFGAGLLGSTHNPGLEAVNQVLERDLQKQRLMYDHEKDVVGAQGTVYAQMREIYGDERAAMAAAHAASKELLVAQGQMILMAKSPQERTLEAQKTLAQEQASALESYRKANDISFEQRVKAEQLVNAENAQAATNAYRNRVLDQKNLASNMFQEEGVKNKQLEQADDLFATYTGPFQRASGTLKAFFGAPLSQQLEPANMALAHKQLLELSQEMRTMKGQTIRFNDHLQKIDEYLSSGSEGGALSKTFKDAVSSGAMSQVFQAANEDMNLEMQERIHTVTGKPVEYWISKQSAKLQALSDRAHEAMSQQQDTSGQ